MLTHHDLGGQLGHGHVQPVDPDEPPFVLPWQGTAFALALLANRISGANLHAFRHAIERVPEPEYFAGYYRRWLAGAEVLLLDSGVLAPGAIDARARTNSGQVVAEPATPELHKPDMPSGGPGNLRTVDRPSRFTVGQRVRVRDDEPTTHTRRPAYVRGRTGIVVAIPGAEVLPDSAAHFLGEDPQHVYTVHFASTDLWGVGAEEFVLGIELFETYLEDAS